MFRNLLLCSDQDQATIKHTVKYFYSHYGSAINVHKHRTQTEPSSTDLLSLIEWTLTNNILILLMTKYQKSYNWEAVCFGLGQTSFPSLFYQTKTQIMTQTVTKTEWQAECRRAHRRRTDSQGSFCCRVWGPATCRRTGSGWDDPAVDEQTRSSFCSPPEDHRAALHHWRRPSL